MKTVYLAGTITGNSVTHEWRETVAEQLLEAGFASLSPLRKKNLSQISADGLRSDIPARLFVTRDKEDIKRCDIVLLNTLGIERLVRPSIGTWAEMGIADTLGKPLIVVADHASIIEHPFVEEMAAICVPTLRAAVDAIKFLQ